MGPQVLSQVSDIYPASRATLFFTPINRAQYGWRLPACEHQLSCGPLSEVDRLNMYLRRTAPIPSTRYTISNIQTLRTYSGHYLQPQLRRVAGP